VCSWSSRDRKLSIKALWNESIRDRSFLNLDPTDFVAHQEQYFRKFQSMFMRNEAQFRETRSSIETRSRVNLTETSSSDEALEKAVYLRTAALLEMNAALQKKLTEHKIIESTLRQSEARLQQIVNGTADGILILNREGIVLFSNAAASILFGYPMEDLLGLDMRLPCKIADTNEIQILCKTDRGMTTRNIEMKLSRTLWEGAFAYLATLRDITERKRSEEELTYSAFHDALTKLPNRAALMIQLEGAIAKTQFDSSYLFAVLFLDLDGFKSVNDRLGHIAGDRLLIEVARRLELCLRPSDQIARLGGDEFVICLNNIHSIQDATHVAERIEIALSSPITWEDQQIFTTASIGIAIGKDSYRNPEELLRDADSAMYAAKKLGQGCYEVFDTAISACIVPKFRQEFELKQALDRQEFILHYQPIIDLRSQKITGFEALLRWIHPERGLIAPDDFIPLAEETGLIIPIGAWVLSEACSQLKIWQREIASNIPLSMSVNVSSLQLRHPGFLAMVEQTLMTTQIQASRLTLEITESVMMEESASMGHLLRQLRAQDIQLSLDDFGTGYSSLIALKQFPISALKLDRSFTQGLGDDPKSLEIVQAVMQLAQKMNMAVIAEGIETASQQNHLQTLDCIMGQGFLFSAAIDSQAAGHLLEANMRLPQWVI
jgi:diguanylate cyclase (GGDEF)-like protein/PAS domain S-box-containing protein